jgi:microcystin-dependent protein
VTQWSAGSDPLTRAQLETSFGNIETLMAIAVQEPSSSMPAAGTYGRIFYATDTHQFSYDTGSAWVPLPSVISRSQVDTSVAIPVGALMPYASSLTAPAGWLNCDGSAVSRSTYAALYAAIGTEWGAGDGSTTFNVPDTRSRTIVGAGSSTSSGLTTRALGATGGEETHALTVAELATHNHGVADPTHNHGGVTGQENQNHTHGAGGGLQFVIGVGNEQNGVLGPTSGNGVTFTAATTTEETAHNHNIPAGGTGITTQNTGSGTGHNNMQPYVGLPYIIKAT